MADYKMATSSYGKTVMELRGPFLNKWRRVNPDAEFMTPDRKWRLQWLNDHRLSPRDLSISIHDLRRNPDWQKARFNIFRRIWQTPMNLLEFNVLGKFMSYENAYYWRYGISRLLGAYVVGVYATYYFTYRTNNWSAFKNWKVMTSKEAVFPGEESPPPRTKPSDYGGHDFAKSPI